MTSQLSARVLVIEDEPDLAQTLRYNLRKEGYEVQLALTGAEGLSLALSFEPSLMILDVMLPDANGFELCARFKAEPRLSAVPVLMLTARGEESDRVQGFEVGAEDYVLKPFSVRELMLRVRALLKRSQRASHATQTSQGLTLTHEQGALNEQAEFGEQAEALTFGELTLDLLSHQAFNSGALLSLTLLEFNLLKTFVERKGRTQSRAVLLRDVWGYEADLSTRTVDTHVKRLREKLGAIGEAIQTVRGIGYRFAQQPPPSPPPSPHSSNNSKV